MTDFSNTSDEGMRGNCTFVKYLWMGTIACTAAILTACSGAGDDPTTKGGSAADKPNVVLLFVDDLAWMDVGFRSDFIDTPNIDKLKTQSVSFERAYVPAPVCSPSRVGLITGQHPAKHDFFRHVGADGKENYSKMGVPKFEYHMLKTDPAQMPSRNWLPLEAVTVAERIKDAGYRTAFVGKWHIGHEPYHPIHQGFDEQHGVTNFGGPNAGYYPPYWRARPDTYKGTPKDKFLTERLTDDAVKIITDSKGAGDPLFLSLWYYGVHKPISGNKKLMQKYLDRGIALEDAEYASMVESVDQSVGRIQDAIAAADMADNTIIVFTSDQGGFYPRAPLRGKKQDGEALFEGGARVPLFVKWPGKAPAGKEVKTAVSVLDVAPTILTPADADLKGLDGTDLMSRLDMPNAPGDPVIMYRHYEDRYAAVVYDGWKLIAKVSGNHELYEIEADIGETDNVYAQNPKKSATLLAILEDWKTKNNIKRFKK